VGQQRELGERGIEGVAGAEVDAHEHGTRHAG
jgi:hypothetical protein